MKLSAPVVRFVYDHHTKMCIGIIISFKLKDPGANSSHTFIGWSRRRLSDPWNLERGLSIALGRAFSCRPLKLSRVPKVLRPTIQQYLPKSK